MRDRVVAHSGAMNDALIDAFVELGACAWVELRHQVDAVSAAVMSAITPPPGLELIDPRGVRYSGLVLLDRGHVVAWLAVPASAALESEPRHGLIRRRRMVGPEDWDPDFDGPLYR